MLEHVERGFGDLRREVIVERVGPQNNARAVRMLRLSTTQRLFERPCRKGRNAPVLMIAGRPLCNGTQAGCLREEVRCPGRLGRDPAPDMDQPGDIGVSGPDSRLVVMGKELGLISGHVDVNGTVALAT